MVLVCFLVYVFGDVCLLRQLWLMLEVRPLTQNDGPVEIFVEIPAVRLDKERKYLDKIT